MVVIGWLILGYLVGSVPVGVVVSRALRGVDIRRYGTGNFGASNTWRNLGLRPAAVVGVASFAQGLLPAWLAGVVTGQASCVVAAGVGAVLGYGWSFFLRLRGGSAVGTATGALAAIWPLGLVPLLGLYAAGGVLRQPAVGVLAGLLAFLVSMKLTAQPQLLVWGCVAIVAMVILRRLDGIQDDIRGEHPAAALVGRLLFDRRPGRHLVGPIE